MIKEWILRQPFVADYVKEKEKDFATRLFKNAREDVLEEIETNVEERAKEIAEESLMKLLSTINWRNVVKIDKVKGFLFVGNERIDEARLANLKSEAEFFMESDLWKVLQDTPKELAQQAMFKDDGSLDTQLLKGRVILYTLSAQQNVIDVFKNIGKK